MEASQVCIDALLGTPPVYFYHQAPEVLQNSTSGQRQSVCLSAQGCGCEGHLTPYWCYLRNHPLSLSDLVVNHTSKTNMSLWVTARHKAIFLGIGKTREFERPDHQRHLIFNLKHHHSCFYSNACRLLRMSMENQLIREFC